MSQRGFGGYGDEFKILMESTGLKYLRSDAGGLRLYPKQDYGESRSTVAERV